MKKNYLFLMLSLMLITPQTKFFAQSNTVIENWETVNSSNPTDWIQTNNSGGDGLTDWFQGNTSVFSSITDDNDYLGANYNNTSGTDTISNWMITPLLNLENDGIVKFWTRKPTGSIWGDRLEIRMSTNGSSSDVGSFAIDTGDFTVVLLDINPDLNNNDYPTSWTEYTITLSGLGAVTEGRLALRYFVTDAGPNGDNSDYIGIDSFSYQRCYFPSDLAATNITAATADLSWIAEGPATSWNVEYGITGYIQGTGTTESASTNLYELSGLTGGVTYDVYIQSDCGTSTSDWIGPITFLTDCPLPTELPTTNITATSVDLNWIETGTASAWNIEYGTPGYTIGYGTNIVTATNPHSLTGLTENVMYDYYIQSDCSGEDSDWAGPFTFNTTLNDDCEDAILISCDDVFTSSTSGATTWTGGVVNCASGAEPENEVWYYFPGMNLEATIFLCNSDYDTRLDVYETSTDCSELACLTGNNDQCDVQSVVTFNAYAGTNYYIAVHGNELVGDFEIEMTCLSLCAPIPGHDECDGATALTIDVTLTGESNSCASNATYASSVIPSCDPLGMIQDVWYTFNSGAYTTLYLQAITTSAADIDLAVYDGCRGVELFCGNEDANGENLTLTGLATNTDYYIQAWSTKPQQGNFDIQIVSIPNYLCRRWNLRSRSSHSGYRWFWRSRHLG